MSTATQRLFHEVPAPERLGHDVPVPGDLAQAAPARGLARPEEILRPPLPAATPAAATPAERG